MTAGSTPADHLLVIGAQRCGTTYLRSVLEEHPQIAMNEPARPEPKVFCSEELAARGRDWYLRTWFSHARDETLLGDKSTSYLEDPLAPGRAAAMLGRPRILVQLRDPVVRACSNWAFSTANGLESRPLEVALEESLAASKPWDPEVSSVSPFAYLERGRYVRYLQPWWDTFGDAVLVVFMEEVTTGGEHVAAIYRALGVDPGFRPTRLGERVNASDAVEKTELTADLEGRLRDYFAETDDMLSRRLGRALPWNHRKADAT